MKAASLRSDPSSWCQTETCGTTDCTPLQMSMGQAKIGPGTKNYSARHKAWKPHKELHKMKGAFSHVHSTNFSKLLSPPKEDGSTSTANPILKSQDWTYLVDSGASLLMMGEGSSVSTE